ncbi:MAG: ATP-dependent protease [Candidatus Omnitrophica bacterium CG11_big_fil_rev_8_21_14_0_20_45_26]|uniref:ATP-dependent protease n=1 Tax=Candidatus Abzuiibacterium crystallinum TaxID=1974748 RepID=A0A2H0LQP1_9BACT|nr:MAG: ATP-dependent protease [Candidatus Omnitrophica bacterium CG11_big_fil_rev_8_21_14_0_20_45_26]
MSDKDDQDKAQKDIMEMMKKIMESGVAVQVPRPEPEAEEPEDSKKEKRNKVLHFHLKPRDVKKHLDRFVIRQEEAKRILSTAVCDHYNAIREDAKQKGKANYVKQNVILLGPTGVGKTYLIRHLADLVGVPFVKADATKFSETGYVGGDVDDLVRELVQKAGGDIELAQYGIIYLDEIDKIAAPANMVGRDVTGAGVQRGLLKMLEETEVSLRNPQDIQSQMQGLFDLQRKGKVLKPVINTRHILMIVSGAFGNLLPIIEKRVRESQIGFQANRLQTPEKSELFYHVQTEDFVEFGFEPEFIGRLPIRAICNPLTQEDLYKILTTSEESILNQYIDAFRAYGIQMQVREKALWEIAKLAAQEKTGARGLFSVLEKTFRDLKFDLPSSHVKEFTLTPEMVTTPGTALRELLKEELKERAIEVTKEIHRFEENFSEKYGIQIAFDESAAKAIHEKVIHEHLETDVFLQQLLSNYVYGLKLIHQKMPRNRFVMTKDVIDNPNVTLDLWIKEAYES